MSSSNTSKTPEEGDISASLKVEATDVCVEPAPEDFGQFDFSGLTKQMCEHGVERYKEAFSLLFPDGNGIVHKSMLLDFFRSVLGPLYSEDMAACLLEIMEPDRDGNISLHSFVNAFSLSYWPPDSVAAMHQVLAADPNLVNKVADWKKILGRLGMNISDQEISKIVDQAQKGATALLGKELAKSKDSLPTKDEVSKKNTQILDAIKERMHLLDIGGNGAKDMSAGESNSEKPIDDLKQKEEKTAQPEEHPVELNN